jgi:hypothetical protein
MFLVYAKTIDVITSLQLELFSNERTVSHGLRKADDCFLSPNVYTSPIPSGIVRVLPSRVDIPDL